jgi:8-oxo-dGTP diphosphatase
MQRVVGAALVRDGRVLAARRTAPAAAVGRWELPGGKVEDGETQDAALVREIAEELGVSIEVRRWLTGAVPIGTSYELVVAIAEIVDGEPEPREHDQVRWLGADELDDVDWLDPDRPFLPELREVLPLTDGRRERG